MQNNKNDKFVFYSSGGFDLLEQYLCMLYGEFRGSYINNLQRYYDSDEFHKQCSVAYSLEDIPEITEQQLHDQVEREGWLKDTANNIVRTYDEHIADDSLTDDDYFAVAGLLGLSGGKTEWYNTMFPHAVNLFVSSEEEEDRLNKKVHDNIGLIQMIVRTMLDGMRNGQALELNGRRYWSQGYARNYYRGENAYYVTSRASLFRGLKFDTNQDPGSDQYDKKVEETLRIGLLKETEFTVWIRQFDFVKNWPLYIYDGAIGQHYGLKTPYLDVTSDIRMALFFACCTYEDGKWRPLRDDEFAKPESRKNVADLGGDSRYGVLFYAPADILSMNAAMKTPCPDITKVTPIGYQPFMRSVNQHGYLIESDLHYDMYQDWNFGKARFRLTRQLCDWIFEEMQDGELVYGNDPVMDISDIVKRIKNADFFSSEAVEGYLSLNPNLKRTDLYAYLKRHGYEIRNEAHWCSPEHWQEIENYWKEHIPENIRGLNIIQRPMFLVG